jgi:dihydrofolate reductase
VKTQYYAATSLDGFIATEDDSLEWLFPLGDINETNYPSFIGEVGAIAMGSAIYGWMLRHAVTVKGQMGSAWPFAKPTWIFSSRALLPVPGVALKFVSCNVQHVYDEMRSAAGKKNIWVVGGGDLAVQSFDAGLLDEIIVQVGSVTLGNGKPLYPRRLTSPPLRLTSARQIRSGFVELRYDVPRSDGASAA